DLQAQPHDDDRNPVIEGVAAHEDASAPAPAPALFREDGERSVTLAVDASRPAQLVLADTYYPGWKATVDGHGVPIHPADAAFRGVAVPAGRHTVRFSYEPSSVRVGALLSLLGVLVVIAGFAVPP